MKSLTRMNSLALSAVALMMTLAFALAGCSNPAVILEPGDDLIIPVSGISEKATFYPLEVDGVEMEILVVKASDGTIRTAFNTCEVCYDSGRGYYVQSGNELICQNCENPFSIDEVGIAGRGACHPYSIYEEERTIDDENITIPYRLISETKDLFANWKSESAE